MKITSMLTTGLLLSVVANATVHAEAAVVNPNPINDQKEMVQKIVHDYLVNNPEVLLEASQALQQKQQLAMQAQAQTAIVKNAAQLLTDSYTSFGNPNAGVTLVEFFDYQCIHCKKMAPVISDLIKKDNNLRVVYKEFPIFGKSSETASKAALAAALQHKYMAMHDALLAQDKNLDDAMINKAAKTIGLDIKKFNIDMASKTVNDAVDANRKLAEQLHLMGTPAFIIAATTNGTLKSGTQPSFIPGAASAQALQDLIKKAASS